MNNKFVRHTIFPVVAAMIWGTSFVAQSVCTDEVPPFAFNAIRAWIAFFLLIFIARAFDRAAARGAIPPVTTDRRVLLIGGVCSGCFLSAASNLQQIGIAGTSAGKAGFITALYVVLVPVFGIFSNRRVSGQVWVSVALAVGGLYLLCIRAGEGLALQGSDVYLLMCAFFFTFQIVSIDQYSAKVSGVKFSCVQFLTFAVTSTVISLLFETVVWKNVLHCAFPILYVAVFSSCVAYTLQILAQKGGNPTTVTLLLSLESVFSVLAGAVILGDRMTGREYFGCLLVFIAVVLAQVPLKISKNTLKS